MNPNPMIPVVSMELELGGKMQTVQLRYSHYATRKIQQATKLYGPQPGPDGTVAEDALPEDPVAYTASLILAVMYPPRKDLDIDDIALALHPANDEYVTGKITEVFRAAGVETSGNRPKAVEPADNQTMQPGTDSKPSAEST